jgi:magnesium-transporting ATPase (P-type)
MGAHTLEKTTRRRPSAVKGERPSTRRHRRSLHPLPSFPILPHRRDRETENDGICYLDTKNLDGETNLKPRRSLTSTQFLSVGEVVRKRFWVDSEKPDVNLYSYNAVFHSDEEVEPINLLLRGCTLRNTPLVLGLVISTGSDTKIMLNSGSTPSKR